MKVNKCFFLILMIIVSLGSSYATQLQKDAKYLVAYVDLNATGSLSMITDNGWKTPNIMIFGFMDTSTDNIRMDYLNSLRDIISKERSDGCLNFISIGGAVGTSNLLSQDPQVAASNIISQLSKYNTLLKNQANINSEIVGIDIDIEYVKSPLSEEIITTLAKKIHEAGYLVSIAPQPSTNLEEGSLVDPSNPYNLYFASQGHNNQYAQSIKKGYVDLVNLQLYNSGGDIIKFKGDITEKDPKFYRYMAEAVSNLFSEDCTKSKYPICIPNGTKIILGEVVNRSAGNSNTIYGDSEGWYNQKAIIDDLVNEVQIVLANKDNKFNHYDGLMYWSLNNDYYPSEYGNKDNYAIPGLFSESFAKLF
ncbi:hypothetical protein IB642_03285 [Allofrancisella guangzhouensis]|uniref:GH18 domain-containing protein n=1 Tax=Allofrancisella guangzhouensis TaxID=594679 RepID=A0A0A8E4D8_9GAMM|nr:hypothetical protein [Allofrancisella guangzhouensis]AJC48467.1 hypothetical protein SD28_01760 [Allofrancisella guangzhouensis]MBK2027631.1 hypothetical protein [Allofrancisella guangzhouensis]MBK2044041.1 hypothetical protein [Allofrancisella guangzhouensis]MBK2046504.1 hypothetical protein [Allofrancisella guangzhouensis]